MRITHSHLFQGTSRQVPDVTLPNCTSVHPHAVAGEDGFLVLLKKYKMPEERQHPFARHSSSFLSKAKIIKCGFLPKEIIIRLGKTN